MIGYFHLSAFPSGELDISGLIRPKDTANLIDLGDLVTLETRKHQPIESVSLGCLANRDALGIELSLSETKDVVLLIVTNDARVFSYGASSNNTLGNPRAD